MLSVNQDVSIFSLVRLSATSFKRLYFYHFSFFAHIYLSNCFSHSQDYKPNLFPTLANRFPSEHKGILAIKRAGCTTAMSHRDA